MKDTRKIYDDFLKYFDTKEIVSESVYNKFKERGDYFFLSRFDIRLLEVMTFIREDLGKPITINNWKYGGNLHQRGLRENTSQIVSSKKSPYLSGHVLSMAFDFDVKGISAPFIREYLMSVSELLPCKIRLENKLNGDPISWVHLDVCDEPKNPKVYLFNV